MMVLASLQTTQARWEAEDAAKEWKQHRGHCPGCDLAVRRRRWGDLCWGGTELYTAHKAAASTLARSRDLDRQPHPDQESLWPG